MSISKQETIVQELREEIAGGCYELGERLPTRSDLQQRFGVSPVTLQRVFDTLIDDGFVVTRGKAGTFVSKRSPHLTHYAMVLTGGREQSRWYRCLANQAKALAGGRRRVSVYEHVDGNPGEPDYQRLVEDIEAKRVAGIIFSTHPFLLVKTPLMTAPDIPRCALMTESVYPDIPSLYPDHWSFARRALTWLADRGSRRVAWLLNSPVLQRVPEQVEQLNRQLGLTTRPSWYQYPDIHRPENVRQIVRLLMDAPADRRPDALVISDDNAVGDATAMLAELGIGSGELRVVACCNFPEPPPCHVDATLLGFDVRSVVACCMGYIDRMRSSDMPPPITRFSACFEHELNQTQPVAEPAIQA